MRARLAAVLAAAGVLAATPGGAQQLSTIDRYVPHVSTVPANRGQRVGLFVREKLSTSLLDEIESGQVPESRVVLFVHGVSVPSLPDFDLDHADYSWMAHLAEAGFDTFAMDHTGYGRSPRPQMDDPCNVSPDLQALLVPNPLEAPCEPSYASQLTGSGTDWDEIDTVVDYIRELRGVERVSLIGWSLGGSRTGAYAARHPEKVDRLVLFAPFYQRDEPSMPPEGFPVEGVPMTLQTRDALMQQRWFSNVVCEDQVEPGMEDVVWRSIMAVDSFGSVWGPEHGVMRVRTASYWGWNAQSAARIAAPTLILVGEQDGLLAGGEALYEDLTGAANRVLVRMDCATHFAVWEASQYKLLHEASREWLETGRFRGRSDGEHAVAFGGRAR